MAIVARPIIMQTYERSSRDLICFEKQITFRQAFEGGQDPQVKFYHDKVNDSTLILLTKGEKLKVKGITKSKFLLISGKPIGEPIARGGPFVMNTKAEILQAVEDYHSGNFVQK